MKRAAILLLLSTRALAEPSPLVADNCIGCHTEDMLAQQRLTAKQWTAVIKKMQGWGSPIEDGNVDALVRELAGRLSGGFVPPRIDAAAAAAMLAPLPDGKWKGGNAKRGKAAYAKNCESCHGADGHGTPTGVNLADRPLLFRAAEFVAPVRSGKGRMPAYGPELIKDAELASILAYLRTLE